MTEKILLVDDEAQLLQGLRRNLQEEFDIVCANSPQEALDVLNAGRGDFAVIVSDYKMPGMNGVDLLRKVKELHPETVRMVLTGFADVGIITEAINEGAVFRFLSKPCPPDQVRKALRGGLEQYRLILAQRELLDKTLMGSIQVISELLSSLDPVLYSRVKKARSIIQVIGKEAISSGIWEAELAALLSSLGWLTVPQQIVGKLRSGKALDPEEQKVIEGVPETTVRLLAHIPRLERVTETILREKESCPAASAKGEPMPWMILRACRDLAVCRERKASFLEALEAMDWAGDAYHPACVDALHANIGDIALLDSPLKSEVRQVAAKDLKPGMLVKEPIVTRDGLVIVPALHEIHSADIERVRNFACSFGIIEPILVIV